MNILYISYEGLTSSVGRSQILPLLCGLVKKDIQISVLSLEDEHTYKKSQKCIQEIVENAQISWTPLVAKDTITGVSFLRNRKRMKDLAKKLCKISSFDVVHCRSYLAASLGLYLKKKYHLKLLFDMRLFYADDRIDTNNWKSDNCAYRFLYRYFKKKEKALYHFSDYIVTKTQTAKAILTNDYSVNIPVSVIPSCVDFELFNKASITQEDKCELRQKLGITKDDFVVSYIGSLGNCYMLDEMMKFMRELIQVRPQTKFLVITPDNEELVMQSAQKQGIEPQKIIVDFAMRKQMPLYISITDVSLFFIRPVFSKKASSPKKMGEVLSLGVPIITNGGIGDVNAIVKPSTFGILVDDFSIKSYKDAISKLDDLLKVDSLTCSEAAKYYFSLEKGVAEYVRIYQKIK